MPAALTYARFLAVGHQPGAMDAKLSWPRGRWAKVEAGLVRLTPTEAEALAPQLEQLSGLPVAPDWLCGSSA